MIFLIMVTKKQISKFLHISIFFLVDDPKTAKTEISERMRAACVISESFHFLILDLTVIATF